VLWVGTSGWQYRDWRDAFYEGLPTSRWLEVYGRAFATVEVNSTFYRLPAQGTLRKWASGTPDDFCFVVKASRYLTHIKRLQGAPDAVRRLHERTTELGPKLGAVLIQLPPTMRRDDVRLSDALTAFSERTGGVRVAFEPRHESWHDDAVYELLASRDAAWCWWDRQGTKSPLVQTASWIYLRLHEGRATPAPCYGADALDRWCDRIGEIAGDAPDGYVFFNNDHCACAPRNAVQFGRRAASRGMTVSRLPRATPPTAR
jgi:uncharacterized protein YecE (DUF72 family)